MPKDPVCEIEVDETTASKTEYEEQTYYFCCEPCKDAFEKNPEKYVEKKTGKRGCSG